MLLFNSSSSNKSKLDLFSFCAKGIRRNHNQGKPPENVSLEKIFMKTKSVDKKRPKSSVITKFQKSNDGAIPHETQNKKYNGYDPSIRGEVWKWTEGLAPHKKDQVVFEHSVGYRKGFHHRNAPLLSSDAFLDNPRYKKNGRIQQEIAKENSAKKKKKMMWYALNKSTLDLEQGRRKKIMEREEKEQLIEKVNHAQLYSKYFAKKQEIEHRNRGPKVLLISSRKYSTSCFAHAKAFPIHESGVHNNYYNNIKQYSTTFSLTSKNKRSYCNGKNIFEKGGSYTTNHVSSKGAEVIDFQFDYGKINGKIEVNGVEHNLDLENVKSKLLSFEDIFEAQNNNTISNLEYGSHLKAQRDENNEKKYQKIPLLTTSQIETMKTLYKKDPQANNFRYLSRNFGCRVDEIKKLLQSPSKSEKEANEYDEMVLSLRKAKNCNKDLRKEKHYDLVFQAAQKNLRAPPPPLTSSSSSSNQEPHAKNKMPLRTIVLD